MCGGTDPDHYRANYEECLQFSAGSWTSYRNTSVPRKKHMSWASPEGLVLMGGSVTKAKHSTELLSNSSQTSTQSFTLMYDSM